MLFFWGCNQCVEKPAANWVGRAHMHEGVIPCIAGPAAVLAQLLEQNRFCPPALCRQKSTLGFSGCRNHCAAPLLLDGVCYLAGGLVGAGAGASGLGKHVCFRKTNFPNKGKALRKFCRCFTGKTDHDVGSNGSIWKILPKPLNNRTVFGGIIVAVHTPQGAVATAL